MLLAMELIERISKDAYSAASLQKRDYDILLKWAQQPYWTRTWVGTVAHLDLLIYVGIIQDAH